MATYADFWTCCLQEHSRPAIRNFHYFGTSAAVLNLCRGMVTGHAWYFRPGVGRRLRTGVVRPFFVEKNRPATFTCPIWSPVSDFRMALCWIIGCLERELDKTGVAIRHR
ncbi:MAG: Mpo1-like protein [Rhizomicrobium sp.]